VGTVVPRVRKEPNVCSETQHKHEPKPSDRL